MIERSDMCTYVRIDLYWVVVTGLELLSLACPGLDLGRVITLLLLSPLLLLWLFDPISMENRIWGDRNGTGWCDANGSRICPVRCWKLVISYHAQI
jgi:hypothetical protein